MDLSQFTILVKETEVNAHLWHLSSNSYAEHKALESLYEDLRDNLDAFIETTFGKSGIKIDFQGKIEVISRQNIIPYLKQTSKEVENYIKEKLSTNKDLENLALEILETLNHTLYLLTLK